MQSGKELTRGALKNPSRQTARKKRDAKVLAILLMDQVQSPPAEVLIVRVRGMKRHQKGCLPRGHGSPLGGGRTDLRGRPVLAADDPSVRHPVALTFPCQRAAGPPRPARSAAGAVDGVRLAQAHLDRDASVPAHPLEEDGLSRSRD